MSSPVKVFTATDRVLTTVELLTRILEYCTEYDGQTYRNALVSRTWSDEALSILWSELDSFIPLLKLLGPMSLVDQEGDRESRFRYDRLIRPQDWAVFRRYSWRIREICHLEYASEVDSSVVFDLMATVAPPFPTDPLIRIHPECDAALAAIPQLRVIWVPPTLFVASTLNVLARLPHLEVLDATRACRQTKLDLTASSLADTFPALTTLRTDALSFDDIATLLETTKPRHLCNLDVFACGLESKQTCLRLIATVASTCPEIEEINIRRSPSYFRGHVDVDLNQSTFSFLSPTHCCLYLTSLVLKDTPCLCLNVETMKTLLSSFPSLETLELNERVEPTTLPLSALSELAELCPSMRFLSLCVDTERFSTSTPTTTRFDCLELLNVGISPLKSSAFHVASYLATILPDPCVLRAEGASNERAKWMPVIQFLPTMLELRTAKEKLRLLPS
ncbi:hypothetical protein EYR38_002394 [Pleurotus pulmonarius]|nr:hypothetical protein EYR38_002394 [Pleurotus pulmonarius]